VVRTNTLRHRDGRLEIVRVLSTSELASWNKEEPLSYEKSIVWLVNVARLPFVRMFEVRCATSRRGRLSIQGRAKVVGYSKLMADAPRDPQTRRYTRRLFYLTEEDQAGVPPRSSRVYDPKTVLPGVPGRIISLEEQARLAAAVERNRASA
jgi:hypothetical protein